MFKTGHKFSPETLEKLRLSHIGKAGGMLGKNHSEESRKKMSVGHKGKKLSEETRKKISEIHKGKTPKNISLLHSPEMRKKAGLAISKALKGRVLSEEWRKKLSLARIGRFCGENHPNWNGGKSFEPYPVIWTETLRRSIRERDNYTCKLCGKIQENLNPDVHHIDYDKKNCDPKNLITLCHSCNAKVNINRDYWEKYLKFHQLLELIKY